MGQEDEDTGISNTERRVLGSTGPVKAQLQRLTQAPGRGGGTREGFSKEVMPTAWGGSAAGSRVQR